MQDLQAESAAEDSCRRADWHENYEPLGYQIDAIRWENQKTRHWPNLYSTINWPWKRHLTPITAINYLKPEMSDYRKKRTETFYPKYDEPFINKTNRVLLQCSLFASKLIKFSPKSTIAKHSFRYREIIAKKANLISGTLIYSAKRRCSDDWLIN